MPGACLSQPSRGPWEGSPLCPQVPAVCTAPGEAPRGFSQVPHPARGEEPGSDLCATAKPDRQRACHTSPAGAWSLRPRPEGRPPLTTGSNRGVREEEKGWRLKSQASDFFPQKGLAKWANARCCRRKGQRLHLGRWGGWPGSWAPPLPFGASCQCACGKVLRTELYTEVMSSKLSSLS